MSCSPPQQSEQVRSLLQLLEKDRASLLQIAKLVVGETGSPMFPLDFLVFAAVKRATSTTTAFSSLVASWNMLCARSLLRLHIDTALRFSAAWLVSDPHDFAMKVLGDKRIDKLQDKSGARLTDAHLVKVRSSDYPWLPDVYARLSGYIHFSGSHIFGAVSELSEDGTLAFDVSDTDDRFPESSWVEIIKCFRESTAMLSTYFEGYAMTKRLTPDQLKALHAGA